MSIVMFDLMSLCTYVLKKPKKNHMTCPQYNVMELLKLQVFPAVVRELNSTDQSKLQNHGSIKKLQLRVSCTKAIIR